jgi:hypothetical protein
MPLTPFTPETAAKAGSKPKTERWRDYRNALRLQELMIQVAEDDEAKGSEKASAARVWVDLLAARRIMLGLGSPKAVTAANDPSASPKRKRGQSSAQQSASPTPDAPE